MKRILSASSALVSVIGPPASTRARTRQGRSSQPNVSPAASCPRRSRRWRRSQRTQRRAAGRVSLWPTSRSGASRAAAWRVGVPSDFVAQQPNVSAVLAAVEAEPKVQAWKALHPKYGGRDVYGF